MGFDLVDVCANLVSVSACSIHLALLLQHTSFKISFVHTSNAMDQMLFCYMAVIKYASYICQCGASANAFKMCRIA